MSLNKDSLRSFAERLVAEHRGGDADPVPAIGVTASDALAMLAEIERLTAQVQAFQSDANIWQSGYAEGRRMGTKIAYSELAQVKNQNDALRSIVVSLTSETPRGAFIHPGNSPGHDHTIPGVWDQGNSGKAGSECGWCKAWNAAQAMAKDLRPVTAPFDVPGAIWPAPR